MASKALSSWLVVAHLVDNLKLFIVYRALRLLPEVIHVNHNFDVFVISITMGS